MIIGVPKELKSAQNCVSLTPASVGMLVKAGHKVMVQKDAGIECGFFDDEYEANGAKIVGRLEELYAAAKMIIKIEEPLSEEYGLLKNEQIVLSFLHGMQNAELAKVLLKKKVTSIAFDLVEKKNGTFPLLEAINEVAGKAAVQKGASMLEKQKSGRGILLGGATGVYPAQVSVLGAGTAGYHAAVCAAGMGALVCVLDTDVEKLKKINNLLLYNIATLFANEYNIKKSVSEANLLIDTFSTVCVEQEILVSKEMVKDMKNDSAIVNVGYAKYSTIETVRKGNCEQENFEKHGVKHFSAENIPQAVCRSLTTALNNAVIPYIIGLADKEFIIAAKGQSELIPAIVTYHGELTNSDIAAMFNMKYTEISMLIGI